MDEKIKKLGRSHEECDECLLQYAMPQSCKGHVPGPSACLEFVPANHQGPYNGLMILRNDLIGLEPMLEFLEMVSRNGNLIYESRLAASLRDILRVHYIDELNYKQMRLFVSAISKLFGEWGTFTREKNNEIRTKLLEADLTWLPVTEKAEKEIEEIRKEFEL